MTLFDELNLGEVSDEDTYEPLPEGEYELVVTEVEQKENSKGTGELIKATLEIPEGAPAYAGRRIWANFNVSHTNPKAEQIGKRQFKSFLAAVNKQNVGSLDELEGAELKVKVGIRPAQNGYDAQNEVKKYFPYSPSVF